MNSHPDDKHRRLARRLADALSHLSWPAEQQKSYLAELGVAPSLDELALEFDDALRPIVALYDDLGVDEGTREMFASIDAILRAMVQHPGSPLVWESPALDDDPRWATIRRIAGSAHVRLQANLEAHSAGLQ